MCTYVFKGQMYLQSINVCLKSVKFLFQTQRKVSLCPTAKQVYLPARNTTRSIAPTKTLAEVDLSRAGAGKTGHITFCQCKRPAAKSPEKGLPSMPSIDLIGHFTFKALMHEEKPNDQVRKIFIRFWVYAIAWIR